MADKPITSENLAKFHERMDRLISLDKCSGRISGIVAPAALSAAETYYGGAVGVIKHLIENHFNWRQELTPEEVAEYDLMEREENERMIADFTPRLENPMYQDDEWLAKWLLSEAVTGGDFDSVFENIMIHRYGKSVEQTIDGETAVWRKIKTIDEFESVII